MAVPKKVKEQAEKAKQLHAEVYGPKDGKKEEPQLEKEQTTPEAEPEKAQEQVAEPKQEPEKAQEPPQQQDEAAVWKHKYETLQGKYSAEVPRLHRELKELRAELANMQQTVVDMKAKEVEVEEPQETAKRLLDDSDIEDYGEDLIDVIKRAAKEEFLPELEKLREENEQLKQQLSGVSHAVVESARDKLLKTLDNEVPNWKDINTDDEFLNWLEGVDLFSGMRRHDLLLQAYEQNDAPRVVAFFKEFIKEQTTLAQPAPQAATELRQPKVDMESLVAPGKPSGVESQSGAQTDERVWTQSDIAAFYRDARRGVYKGRESEKKAIEREIMKAVSEGRVR